MMIASFAVLWALFKYGAPVYNEWAAGQIAKIAGILEAARENHRASVKSRIDNVKQLGGVIDVTKQLFEVSKVCMAKIWKKKVGEFCRAKLIYLFFFKKETARLEAEVFELQQRTALAQEARSVLDSWVRYEGQVKQRQQKELADTVIGKVMKELENPRVLQQILQQSVGDVERKSSCFCVFMRTFGIVMQVLIVIFVNRDYIFQSAVNSIFCEY